MKKLNIFKRSSREDLPAPSAPTDTLHRIVNAKEEAQRKWEADEEEHKRKKRDYEIRMIEMEEAEVERRDKEVEKLNALLADTKRKNQKVQDKMIEQIEIIKNKLEEYKLDHKTHESSIEDDIVAKTEKKGYVQSSLDQRKKALEIDFQSDNVDSSDQENSGKFGEDEAYTANVRTRHKSVGEYQREYSQIEELPTPPSPYAEQRWSSAATLPAGTPPNFPEYPNIDPSDPTI